VRVVVPSNHRFTYGLHGAISQKMTVFITTGVRTSAQIKYITSLHVTGNDLNKRIPITSLSLTTI
jgi:hypothetical protein